MDGWYNSHVIVPDAGSQIIWLGPNGREVTGTYDRQGTWCTSTGQRLWYVPLFWRLLEGDDHPDAVVENVTSARVTRRRSGRTPCDLDDA